MSPTPISEHAPAWPNEPMTRTKLSFRQWLVPILFRWLLAFHVALLWMARRLPRWRKPLADSRPRTVLLTGTFFSENWIMNHLRPLVLSESCARATVVSLFPIPETPKVGWIAPPRWLCRMLGETPARLLVFVLTALRQRPDVVGGFHLISGSGSFWRF